jgi:hypothetical protein
MDDVIAIQKKNTSVEALPGGGGKGGRDIISILSFHFLRVW